MFRALREWSRRRNQKRGAADESPALSAPEQEADLIKLIQSAQANLPGRPQ